MNVRVPSCATRREPDTSVDTPAVSSSATSTVKNLARPWYPAKEPATSTEKIMLALPSASSTSSSTAVTWNVCGVSQSDGVNVNLDGVIDSWLVPPSFTSMTTSVCGRTSRTMLPWVEAPPSVRAGNVAGVTVYS